LIGGLLHFIEYVVSGCQSSFSFFAPNLTIYLPQRPVYILSTAGTAGDMKQLYLVCISFLPFWLSLPSMLAVTQ